MQNDFELFNQLTTVLNKCGIRYTVEIPGRSIIGNYNLQAIRLSSMFRLQIFNGWALNHTYLVGYNVPYTQPLLEFANIINANTLLGNFEFTVAPQRVFRYRLGVPGSIIKDDNVAEVVNFVNLPSIMLSKYFPGLYQIVNSGISPQEAVNMCDRLGQN